jgi:ipoprotein LpqH
VKHGLLIAACGGAIVVAGLTACSSSNNSSPATTSPAASPNTAASAAAGSSASSQVKVTIDGQDQNVQGQVACTDAGGSTTIAIGGPSTGIGAVLTDGSPPVVKSVGLGNVNGLALGYTAGTGQGNAEATQDGKTFDITGSATGADLSNPTQMATKPFEIKVTCP